MDSFTSYNYDMNRAVIKNLKTKLHNFQKNQTWLLENSVKEQMEKAFRNFTNGL